MESTSGTGTVRFASRTLAAPPKPKKPIPSLSSLLDERLRLWNAALEPTTSLAYQRAVRDWSIFARHGNFDFFPRSESLSLFITFRFAAVSNILPILSGLAYHFKAIDSSRWDQARSSEEVKRAIRGHAKLFPHVVKKAVPLPLDILAPVLLALNSPQACYDDVLWGAMATVAFFSCARAAELTSYDSPRFRNENKYSLRSTLRLDSLGFSVHLPYHKSDPLYSGSHLWFTASDASSFLPLLSTFLRIRDLLFPTSAFLWVRANGKVPTRRWFVSELKRRCGETISGHSFRSGGATWYALQGASDSSIQRLGRWKSAAWNEYVRLQPELALATRSRDNALSQSFSHPLPAPNPSSRRP
jgi:hypothetical protein